MRELKSEEWTCDLCREERVEAEQGEVPKGWSYKGRGRKQRQYCPECGPLVDEKNAKRFPANLIAHTPQGPHYCCHEHARGLKTIFGVLGCHVAVQLYDGPPVACINCINETKEETHEEAEEVAEKGGQVD